MIQNSQWARLTNSDFKGEKSKFDLLYISSFNDEKKLIPNTEMTVKTYHKNQPDLLRQIIFMLKKGENIFIYGKKEDQMKWLMKNTLKNIYLINPHIKNNRLKSIEIIEEVKYYNYN